ncbi:hypothetical protein B4099_0596 [Heyndrickxia coagulans]|uniref:Uncharacterized protein n=1 Tax=Heyndrickxia coagulans TaxID=1398 RepID=A0A150KHB8_HEYCO|nr:hypothetical protein B4099_0596 [Heyndrickxia coagulans]
MSIPLFIKKRMPHTNIQDRLFRTPHIFSGIVASGPVMRSIFRKTFFLLRNM